jgi:hypothetical protein
MQTMSTKKKRKKGLRWAAVLATIPLAGLVWTVVTYIVDRRPAVLPQERFVLLRDDDLVDFVNSDKQKALLKDLPFQTSLVHSDACYQDLLQYFSPKALHDEGRRVKSAVFLAITNAGREPSVVRFRASPEIPDYHGLGPTETLLLCVKINRVDGKGTEVEISNVELLSARGFGRSLEVTAIPQQSEMATIPGRPGLFLGSPVTPPGREDPKKSSADSK